MTRAAMSKTYDPKYAVAVTQNILPLNRHKTDIMAIRLPEFPGLPSTILDLHNADIIDGSPQAWQ
ncbi:hypothetical protein C2U55_14330 [Enterobacteriaceae bacterium ENNIH3]|nr:hypothetical protein C2U55_14330 [Enterobacteriaceae bacterium ENNIH3]